MHRDVDVNWIPMLVLCLSKLQSTCADVLRAKAHGVFTSTRRKAEEVESESGFRIKRMSRFILLNLCLGPAMMIYSYVLDLFDTDGRIMRRFILLNRPGKQRLKSL